MREVVYKDPTPETMKDLKRRLKQALKNIPLSTLYAATATECDKKTKGRMPDNELLNTCTR